MSGFLRQGTASSYAFRKRMARSIEQPLMLLKVYDEKTSSLEMKSNQYDVLGSTGNVYTVAIGPECSCTCPDHTDRGNRCKHILFILHRYLRLPMIFIESFDTGNRISSTDLMIVFERDKRRPVYVERRAIGEPLVEENIKASDTVVQVYSDLLKKKESGEYDDAKAKRHSLEQDGNECPICYLELVENAGSRIDPIVLREEKSVTWCRNQCGQNFHLECINAWIKQLSKASCPLCRTLWNPEEKKIKTYVNLGEVAGLCQHSP